MTELKVLTEITNLDEFLRDNEMFEEKDFQNEPTCLEESVFLTNWFLEKYPSLKELPGARAQISCYSAYITVTFEEMDTYTRHKLKTQLTPFVKETYGGAVSCHKEIFFSRHEPGLSSHEMGTFHLRVSIEGAYQCERVRNGAHTMTDTERRIREEDIKKLQLELESAEVDDYIVKCTPIK